MADAVSDAGGIPLSRKQARALFEEWWDADSQERLLQASMIRFRREDAGSTAALATRIDRRVDR